MGASTLTVLFFSAIWAAVAIGGWMLAPHGPQRQLIQCTLLLTASCCWLFWLCCYLAQMNPMIGPRLSKHAIQIIADSWDMPLKNG